MYGGMAMQGLLAYVYDEILPGTWVELNQCRFNHLGVPAWGPRIPFTASSKCMSDSSLCEDCTKTDLSDVYNIHFAGCKKPWLCVGDISYIRIVDSLSPFLLDVDHCLELHTEWHAVRSDLEEQLLALTGDVALADGQVGTYQRDIFHGHCTGHGIQNYLSISASSETIRQLDSLYTSTTTVSTTTTMT
jgi:hypothetical protein